MNFGGSVRSSIGLLHNGQSWSNLHRKEIKPTPPSRTLVRAAIMAYIGAIFFIMAFISPYWLQSYEYTYTAFLNMGLWEFCFSRYRHYDFQFDKVYDGCNHVFSFEFQQIREWLLPAWLMATQSFMTIALLCLATCLTTLSLTVIRVPMKGIMRQEWKLIAFCAVLQAITFLSIFLSVVTFGAMCWSRDWLLYPNFHYLSWSYVFAVIAGAFQAVSGLMLFSEKYDAKERKQQSINMMPIDPSVHSMPISSHSMPISSHSMPISAGKLSSQGYI